MKITLCEKLRGVSIFSHGVIFTRARVLLAPLFLRENGDYLQSTAVPTKPLMNPKDYVGKGNNNVRTTEQKRQQGEGRQRERERATRKSWSDINITTTNKANCGKSIEAIYAT